MVHVYDASVKLQIEQEKSDWEASFVHRQL